MGFWSRLFGKTGGGANFLDSDRELSLQLRKSNAEIKQQRQQLELEMMRLEHERRKIQIEADIARAREELEELTGEDDDVIPEEGGNFEDKMLMMLLAKVMGGNSAPSAPVASVVTPTSFGSGAEGVSLTDAQIEEYWQSIPEVQRKLILRTNEEDIKRYLQPYKLSEDTLTRVLKYINSKK